jgi:hypothetical protein
MADNLGLKKVIENIIFLIVTKQEYKEAAKLMISNNITMSQLSQLTLKISIYKMARLTDSIIQVKKGK